MSNHLDFPRWIPGFIRAGFHPCTEAHVVITGRGVDGPHVHGEHVECRIGGIVNASPFPDAAKEGAGK